MTATLNVLVSFDGTDGAQPGGSLIVDANGNLLGTTGEGGTSGDGTVFEIAKTATGYASTVITLVNFDGTNGSYPQDGLLADANGNLFGATALGGANSDGTVFEIANTTDGYAGVAATLISLHGGRSCGGLIADANGDLFGTTWLDTGSQYGTWKGTGTVFEIAMTATGYASAATALASFQDTRPGGQLTVDANGDLFGTTAGEVFHGYVLKSGSTFEIAKTATGYADTPTILTSSDGTDYWAANFPLIADANGNLFGVEASGGTDGYGGVFEIARSDTGVVSNPTIIASFDSINGAAPCGGLIADANGDLFGTTSQGGAYGRGYSV